MAWSRDQFDAAYFSAAEDAGIVSDNLERCSNLLKENPHDIATLGSVVERLAAEESRAGQLVQAIRSISSATAAVIHAITEVEEYNGPTTDDRDLPL